MGNIDYREYLLKTADNSNLYGQSWRSTHLLGIVVIVHGYAEHSGRYQWAALQLVDRLSRQYGVKCSKSKILSPSSIWIFT